mmetsp:Transcript_49754/g.144370  ORF Transcript_49754/g.144370 Transcript_49754/m.144370 type:complete len:554 (+) Transcript_49754:97-1758(+)
MGNAACGGCKSKESEADSAGDEPPLQVREGDEALSCAPASSSSAAQPVEEQKEWVLQPGANLTVMMFGMTGAGKSALGNLVAGFDAFDYGDDTISVTNLDSVMRYEAEDGSLVLLDTIGLGDTEIDQQKVVASIRDVALSAPGGVDVLLFVMRNARITDEAIARLIYATEYLWGSQCLLNLYIVVTHASRYLASKEEAKAWIDRQVEINWRFRHIYKIVGENPNRFIFIDNPDPKSGEPNLEDRRGASREAVMRMLCLHPVDAIPPFTFSVMERAKELTSRERAEHQEELHSADSDRSRSKPSRQKRPLKQKPSQSSDTPFRTGLDEAGKHQGVVAMGMRQALLKAKADETLQLEANREVVNATLRFRQRWETESEADAGAGSPQGVKPVASGNSTPVPESLRQACKRFASFVMSRALTKKGSSKVSIQSSSADSAAEGSKADNGQPAAELVHSESWECVLNDILAHVRSNLEESSRVVFFKLDKMGTGAITPMEFTQFLRAHMPGIRHEHIGGLWRRADLNCDGQLDLKEFSILFGPVREPPLTLPQSSPSS